MSQEGPPLPDLASERRMILMLVLIVEGGLVFLSLLMGWSMCQPPLMHLHWNSADVLWGCALTLPTLAMFALTVHYPIGPLQGLKDLTQKMLAPMFRSCTITDLLCIALLAGLGEEMVFRGVLQSAITRWANPIAGLVVASLLFGLMHALTPTYALLASLMGAYLGWVYLWTDNLLPAILIHALYDLFALMYLVRGPGKPTELLEDVFSDDENDLPE